MRWSSVSGREGAQEVSAVQPVNGFHRDVESQSTIRSETDRHNHACAPRVTRIEAFSSIVHVSHAICDLIIKIGGARNISSPILITGETGTGKELLARAVHDASDRRERKFIPFNCATANRELIESRLFGHERGAFTGAERGFKGIIREADGGTLLLDEVGDLSLDLQPMLLRFLQENEVHPLGVAEPIKTDVRVIAATNRDLEADVQSGRFRADLYYRLNAQWARIPALRERREDIPLLINHFLGRYQQKYDKQGLQLSDEALALMFGYYWPGNVREVENLLLRLVLSARDGEVIGPDRVLPEIGAKTNAHLAPLSEIVEGRVKVSLGLPYHDAINAVKRLFITNVLTQTNGNRSQAAAILGMSREGLGKTIKRLKIKADGIERQTATEYSDTQRRVIVRADLNTTGDGKLITVQHYDQLGRIRLTRRLESGNPAEATDETKGIKIQPRYFAGNKDNPADPNAYELVSAPYRATTSGAAGGEPGMAWKRTKFDKGGRVIEIETFVGATLPAPWGSNLIPSGKFTTEYDAEFTTVTDQALKKRRSRVDGLGRLVRVDEPDAGGNLGAITAPAQPTDYSYNALDNLIQTSQTGVPNGGSGTVTQNRTFSFSSLGRLVTANNPESGVITYEYDRQWESEEEDRCARHFHWLHLR